jgi:hypothetical protein
MMAAPINRNVLLSSPKFKSFERFACLA